MLNPVVIIRREDLSRAIRDLPLEQINLSVMHRRGYQQHHADERTAELILFVDHQDGNGQIKVLKSRRLGAKLNDEIVALPTNTVLPSDLFDDLVCERLDLNSPRVVIPEATRPRPVPATFKGF